jgi:uncharacterized protein (TIGR00369 family)
MTLATTRQFTPQPLPREQLAGLSGRETLEKVLNGELPAPPFAPTMLIDLIEVGEGCIAFSGQPDFSFLNPMGTVHGGWIATILDSAMGCAVHSTLKPGQLYTTTAMSINYVRPLMADSGAVRCEATTVYSGARMATSEGRLIDGKGRLIAHGSESCMILEAK